jgi:hypothetical protein
MDESSDVQKWNGALLETEIGNMNHDFYDALIKYIYSQLLSRNPFSYADCNKMRSYSNIAAPVNNEPLLYFTSGNPEIEWLILACLPLSNKNFLIKKLTPYSLNS